MPQLSLHSPVGDLTISEENGAIVSLDWGFARDQTATAFLRGVRKLLFDYFDGAPLAAVPLRPAGTPYQKKIWAALTNIPAGETRTYIEIARAAGGSARSVGGANRANKIPIFIPCHRVVAVGGIGGYSGGDGPQTKLRLLQLERGTKI
jgi:methylated-DNA-[protein]-cysteine S-methyltransferase